MPHKLTTCCQLLSGLNHAEKETAQKTMSILRIQVHNTRAAVRFDAIGQLLLRSHAERQRETHVSTKIFCTFDASLEIA
jgi:hypothetical protein